MHLTSCRWAVGKAVQVSTTIVFDHPTVRQLLNQLSPKLEADAGKRVSAYNVINNDGLSTFTASRVEMSRAAFRLPLSVDCQFALLHASTTSSNLLIEIPASRWLPEDMAPYVLTCSSQVASRTRHGAFLSAAELFDNAAFQISVAEAAAMDPQQRQLLEIAYVALLNNGIHSRQDLLGRVVGVAVGQWASEFATVLARTAAGSSVYAATGHSCSVTCGRVSFVLGLHGPCATYDTACSASLVATHGSMRALQNFECAHSVSAGVNMILDTP